MWSGCAIGSGWIGDVIGYVRRVNSKTTPKGLMWAFISAAGMGPAATCERSLAGFVFATKLGRQCGTRAARAPAIRGPLDAVLVGVRQEGYR